MLTMIGIEVEIPEDLHESLKGYLDAHPDWDQSRVFACALSLFLLQNHGGDRSAAGTYLDSLFGRNGRG